jgi:hypothetical protein
MNAKQLEGELRRQAQGIKADAPPGMEHRIAAAVRGAAAENGSSQSAPAFWLPRLTIAGAFGLALAAAVVAYRRAATPAAGSAALQADSQVLAQAVKTAPRQLWAVVQPRAETVVQAEPLHREAAALQADARSAIGFLAYNFLPTNG